MTRPARFKQSEATALLRATEKAGKEAKALVVEPNGRVWVSFVGDGVDLGKTNPLDRILPR